MVAPAAPPPRPCVKADDNTLEAPEGDLPDVRLIASDYMLYGVFQNWMHQNQGVNILTIPVALTREPLVW